MTANLFYFLSFVALLGALMVVLSRNPVYSVLYLILTLFTVSCHYILLNAQFLFAVNIIVYAGAIMVLFLFVIMFLNLKTETSLTKGNLSKLGAAVAAGCLLVVLVAAVKTSETATAMVPRDSQIGLVENLGKVLYTDYLVPFELVSVLFLTSMAGAVMLGRREPGERNVF